MNRNRDLGNISLRKIECSHHVKREGDSFKKMYHVSLSTDDGDGYSEFMNIDFKSHETAIAFCLGRMSGNFKREMTQPPFIDFETSERNMMWRFVIEECVEEVDISDCVEMRCNSRILVRRSLNDEFVEYNGIGHMGVLGMFHIIETIASDNHLDSEMRSEVSMFSLRDRIYVINRFHKDLPCVYGRDIIRGNIISANYHVETVTFHNFGTVVKKGKRYFLDGQMVYFNPAEDDPIEVLDFIAEKFPNAERYETDMDFGSMDNIRNRRKK